MKQFAYLFRPFLGTTVFFSLGKEKTFFCKAWNCFNLMKLYKIALIFMQNVVTEWTYHHLGKPFFLEKGQQLKWNESAYFSYVLYNNQATTALLITHWAFSTANEWYFKKIITSSKWLNQDYSRWKYPLIKNLLSLKWLSIRKCNHWEEKWITRVTFCVLSPTYIVCTYHFCWKWLSGFTKTCQLVDSKMYEKCCVVVYE